MHDQTQQRFLRFWRKDVKGSSHMTAVEWNTGMYQCTLLFPTCVLQVKTCYIYSLPPWAPGRACQVVQKSAANMTAIASSMAYTHRPVLSPPLFESKCLLSILSAAWRSGPGVLGAGTHDSGCVEQRFIPMHPVLSGTLTQTKACYPFFAARPAKMELWSKHAV